MGFGDQGIRSMITSPSTPESPPHAMSSCGGHLVSGFRFWDSRFGFVVCKLGFGVWGLGSGDEGFRDEGLTSGGVRPQRPPRTIPPPLEERKGVTPVSRRGSIPRRVLHAGRTSPASRTLSAPTHRHACTEGFIQRFIRCLGTDQTLISDTKTKSLICEGHWVVLPTSMNNASEVGLHRTKRPVLGAVGSAATAPTCCRVPGFGSRFGFRVWGFGVCISIVGFQGVIS